MKIPEEIYQIANDIKTMKIRGAGKIARTAAHGLAIAAEKCDIDKPEEFKEYIKSVARILINTRPTAVSLPNAIRYVIKRFAIKYDDFTNVEEMKEFIISAANEFIRRSENAIKRIGEIGARRINDGDIIMTHCNSTSAISVIVTAFKQGKNIQVYATETRPRYQGHITAKMLSDAGVPVTLITDNAVRYFMNDVDKVVVGADAIASNGAVVNKIGTSILALAAHEARTRVYVAAESYKFSPQTVAGELIPIEERDPSEVISPEKLKEMPNVKVRNPAFDVTPPEYIDIIITEKGVIPPQAAIIILYEEFGWAETEDILNF